MSDITVFAKKSTASSAAEVSTASKEEQVIELMKDMTPEQVKAIISAINI